MAPKDFTQEECRVLYKGVEKRSKSASLRHRLELLMHWLGAGTHRGAVELTAADGKLRARLDALGDPAHLTHTCHANLALACYRM
jgi:hypothetical protein